jgi:hypothetical protein
MGELRELLQRPEASHLHRILEILRRWPDERERREVVGPYCLRTIERWPDRARTIPDGSTQHLLHQIGATDWRLDPGQFLRHAYRVVHGRSDRPHIYACLEVYEGGAGHLDWSLWHIVFDDSDSRSSEEAWRGEPLESGTREIDAARVDEVAQRIEALGSWREGGWFENDMQVRGARSWMLEAVRRGAHLHIERDFSNDMLGAAAALLDLVPPSKFEFEPD